MTSPTADVVIARFTHGPSGTEYEVVRSGEGIYGVFALRDTSGLPPSAWAFGNDPSRQQAASAYVVDTLQGPGDYLTSVIVERPHRRRGIATALYNAIEKDLGRPLRPSPRHVSPEAQALWKHRRSRFKGSP